MQRRAEKTRVSPTICNRLALASRYRSIDVRKSAIGRDGVMSPKIIRLGKIRYIMRARVCQSVETMAEANVRDKVNLPHLAWFANDT
jgi:hypothetical protein